MVCFRHLPAGRRAATTLDAHQDRLQTALEASGDGWLTTTRLRGSTWLRAGIVNYLATEDDIDHLLDHAAEARRGHMTHRLATVLVAIAAVWSVMPAHRSRRPGACDLTIVALPADSTSRRRATRCRAAPVVLAGRRTSFDRTAIAIVTDDHGNPAVNIDAAGRRHRSRRRRTPPAMPASSWPIAINGTVVCGARDPGTATGRSDPDHGRRRGRRPRASASRAASR